MAALVDALAELRPGLAVLFMSGHPDDHLIQQLTTRGTPFIQKVERVLAAK